MVIFNNNTFEDVGSVRRGSEKDVKALEEFFKDTLQWNVSHFQNLAAAEIRNTTKEISQHDFCDHDALLYVIKSHVIMSHVIMSHGISCTSFIGKPKFIIIEGDIGHVDIGVVPKKVTTKRSDQRSRDHESHDQESWNFRGISWY